MERSQKLKTYIPLADFIARMIGPGCEVLLHDVQDPDHSVVYVTFPSLTGRSPGDGMTDFAKELLRTQRWRREPFVANYVGGSKERTFRSSTYFLREGEELLGLLCVNVDIRDLVDARRALERLLLLNPEQLSGERVENFGIQSTAEEEVDAVVSRVSAGRPMAALSVEEKRQIARTLQSRGIFSIRGKVSQVADLLQVSEKTLYRYLKRQN